jgi:mRNA-degrading endonuclease toxin of MazEF toxin-antitoxin module
VIELPYADGPPYLPGVGEVYRVDASLVHPAGRGPDRPVLVVQVPATLNGRITLVARTAGQAAGVASPRDPELGFDRPGSWAHLRSAEALLWMPSMVRYRGTVDLAVLTAVREAFGL